MSNAQSTAASPMDKLQLQKLLEKNTKGHIGATLVNTVYDLALGVGAGGLLGAVLGKASFWPGLVISGLGYYYDVRAMQAAGMGMMASSHLLSPAEKAVRTKDGFDVKAELQDAKTRAQKFGQSLLERTYLDKVVSLVKGKKADQDTTTSQDTTETPPPSIEPAVNGLGEPDYTQLDKIGQQVVSSAVVYQRANPQSGGTMSGTDDEMVSSDKW